MTESQIETFIGKELEIKMEGADDMAMMLIGAMRNIGILANKPMTEHDLQNLKEMLLGIRNVLQERYKRQADFYEKNK